MIIYTDGSCKRTKIGAFGFVVLNNKDIGMVYAKRQEQTTNIQMELNAVKHALIYIKKNKVKKAVIYTDSEYSSKGYSTWMHRWVVNNWQKDNGNLIKNITLWKEIYELFNYFKLNNIECKIEWVKSHSNNKYNNYIDNIVQKMASN